MSQTPPPSIGLKIEKELKSEEPSEFKLDDNQIEVPSNGHFFNMLKDFEKEFKTGNINNNPHQFLNPAFNFSPSNIIITPSKPNTTQQQAYLDSDLKPIGSQLINNEIDWFGFQTQLRKIVYELVEPTVKRSLQSEINIVKMQDESSRLRSKIDEMEVVFQKSQKRAISSDDVNRKMFENDHQRKIHELKVRAEIDTFKDQIMQFKQRLEQVEDEAIRYQNQTQIQQNELQAVIEQFELIRTRLATQMTDIYDSVKQELNEIRGLATQNDLPIKRFQKTLENQKNQLTEIVRDIAIIKSQSLIDQSKISDLYSLKLDKEPFEALEKSIQNSWNCANEEIAALKASATLTDNYLEKYLPVRMLNFVHESLMMFLDRKEIVKVMEYFIPAYQYLESNIANDDGKPSAEFNKQDFMIPSLDINQIFQHRKLQKQMTDNSSSMRGGAGFSSQKSQSQISGITKQDDQQSDARSKYKNGYSKKSTGRSRQNYYANQDQQSVNTSKRSHYFPSYMGGAQRLQSANQQLATIKDSDKANDYGMNAVGTRLPQHQNKTNFNINPLSMNQMPGEKDEAPQINIDRSDRTLQNIHADKLRSDQSILSPNFGTSHSIRPYNFSQKEIDTYHNQKLNNQRIISRKISKKLTVLSKAAIIEEDTSPEKSLKKGEMYEEIKITDNEAEKQKDITPTFPNNKLTKLKGDQKSKVIEIIKANQTGIDQLNIHKQYANNANIDQKVPHIDQIDLQHQSSFQGATFHKSPTRRSINKRQSILLRQSSIDIFKSKGGNMTEKGESDNENQIKEGISHKVEKVREPGDEDLDEDDIDFSDDDKSDVNDDSDELSSSFEGNRVINKRLRALNSLIQSVKKDQQAQFEAQTLKNEEIDKKLTERQEVHQSFVDKTTRDFERVKELMYAYVSSELGRLNNELTHKYDDVTNKQQEQFTDFLQRRKRELSDNQFFQDRIKEMINANNQRVNEIDQVFARQLQLQKYVLESMMILNMVITQEEQDKKSLALIGFNTLSAGSELKEELKQAQQSIKIDKNCVSCSGGSSSSVSQQIRNAFKLACLAYQPQPIDVNGRKFSKEHLLSSTKMLIEKSLQDHYSVNYAPGFLESLIADDIKQQAKQSQQVQCGTPDGDQTGQIEIKKTKLSFFQQLSQNCLIDETSKFGSVDRMSSALINERFGGSISNLPIIPNIKESFENQKSKSPNPYGNYTSQSRLRRLTNKNMQYQNINQQQRKDMGGSNLTTYGHHSISHTRPNTSMHSYNYTSTNDMQSLYMESQRKTHIKIELMKNQKVINQQSVTAPVSPNKINNKDLI